MIVNPFVQDVDSQKSSNGSEKRRKVIELEAVLNYAASNEIDKGTGSYGKKPKSFFSFNSLNKIIPIRGDSFNNKNLNKNISQIKPNMIYKESFKDLKDYSKEFDPFAGNDYEA